MSWSMVSSGFVYPSSYILYGETLTLIKPLTKIIRTLLSGNLTKPINSTQHGVTDLVAAAINEMNSMVSAISKNTTRTSELAGAADAAASKGKEMVSSTSETILELSEDISEIYETINILANECQQIRDITSAISQGKIVLYAIT